MKVIPIIAQNERIKLHQIAFCSACRQDFFSLPSVLNTKVKSFPTNLSTCQSQMFKATNNHLYANKNNTEALLQILKQVGKKINPVAWFRFCLFFGWLEYLLSTYNQE